MTVQHPHKLLARPIAFHPAFVSITGSITAALMLSQAWYWKDRTNNTDGWFYKTQKDWQEETGLTRYEQETARRILKEKGFIEEKTAPPYRLYFRVNMATVFQALGAENPQVETSHVEKPQLRDLQKNEDAGFPHVEAPQAVTSHSTCEKTTCQHVGKPHSIPEITTEITAENKEREQAQAGLPLIGLVVPQPEKTEQPDGRKKEKTPTDLAHQRLMTKRAEVFGKTTAMAREAKAAKWLLDNFTEAEIYEYMAELAHAADERGFTPSLDLVSRQIDVWKRRKAATIKPQARPGYVSQADINRPGRGLVM